MDPNLTSNKAADAFLTRAQVAELFSVSPSTITRWADEGKLTCVRTLGGHRRYQRDEIIELVHTLLQEGERVETIRVEVPKLYADHHTLAVRQVLAGLPGVQDVWVSAAAREVQITFDPEVTKADGIVAALAEAGYPTRNGQEPRPTGAVSKDPAWAQLDLRVTKTMRT
ncbi:MAG: BldC family transcriptional regulator [Caldilineaceae bacterium]|nr:BldC family transcriptional regulator [Caldilineaceae bacterium]